MIAPLSPKGDFGFVETDSRLAILVHHKLLLFLDNKFVT